MKSVSSARKPATWHDTVCISDVSTVTIMDMLLGTALIRYCHQVHPHTTGTIPQVDMTDHHLDIIATPDIPTVMIGTGTDLNALDPTHITSDTGVAVTMTPIEVAPGHFTDPHVIVLHATGAQAHIASAMIHHIADPHHVGISAEMTVNPELINPASKITNPHRNHLPVHSQHPGNLRIENTSRLQLMTFPQSITALMNKTVIERMI